jgi:hypothetical protein
MKHVIVLDDELFRELEAAAATKDCLLEDMAAALLRAGMEASQAGTLRDRRPEATWPPAAERRTRA